jgi:Uma2 family endonuclease
MARRAGTTPAEVIWTYDDYVLLPDDGNRYEVIDGELHVTPAPTTTHQSVSKRIQFELMLQIEHRGHGIVFDAPVDVILARTRTVQPDLVVVRTARRAIVSERGIEGAPDLVVEILSPGTEQTDRIVKRKLYASVGVPEYWLVDPSSHAVEVLVLGKRGYRRHALDGPGESARSTTFDLTIDIDLLFAK